MEHYSIRRTVVLSCWRCFEFVSITQPEKLPISYDLRCGMLMIHIDQLQAFKSTGYVYLQMEHYSTRLTVVLSCWCCFESVSISRPEQLPILQDLRCCMLMIHIDQLQAFKSTGYVYLQMEHYSIRLTVVLSCWRCFESVSIPRPQQLPISYDLRCGMLMIHIDQLQALKSTGYVYLQMEHYSIRRTVVLRCYCLCL
jgi:chorismate mutase